ncbi:hypothetical protein [Massilia sp. CF038]|uniref:hypothetical protein n=1 Tax=Massilia sp. CF038 TaxID=1881045 RepID=UPI00090FBEF0|nr:hypothetical protein [Massilia sp. CF038]SHG51851.1 hypothetical protein SAMN05428948_0832 [Massilia sp. CF038]
MFTRLGPTVISLCLAAGWAAASPPYAEYRVTVMGPANSAATDINNAGVVVGRYPFSPTSEHAFLNRGAGLVDLGKRTTGVVAINDKGQVLGHWTDAGGIQRGFIYERGTWRDIGSIPGRYSSYTDINNAGYVTAFGAIRDSFEGPHSFLRAPDGTFRDIGSLLFDNPITTAIRLNKHNQITGASGPLVFPDQPLRAYVWGKGVMRDLGGFGTEPNSGMAINDCGQVTGFVSRLEFLHDETAFLYSNGRLIDLDTRPNSEYRFSGGTGINNHGHVVGYSNHLSGFVYRGRKMESLNALIDPKLGWDIGYPVSINDAGQIAASADRGGVRYAVRLDLLRPLDLRVPDEARQATLPEDADESDDTHANELVQPVLQ